MEMLIGGGDLIGFRDIVQTIVNPFSKIDENYYGEPIESLGMGAASGYNSPMLFDLV